MILYTNVDRREDRSFLNLFLPFFLSCVLLVFRVFYYNVILYINVVRRCGIEVSFLKLSVEIHFLFFVYLIDIQSVLLESDFVCKCGWKRWKFVF